VIEETFYKTVSYAEYRAPPLSHINIITGILNTLSSPSDTRYQGVTKRCRLSWLTNSALVNEYKCGGGGGELQGLSQ
jgi:hypothetical protein